MRIARAVGIVLAAVIALLAVGLLALRLFVDPNNYKERIARGVKASTGRELALPGQLRLSVFPWIALELGPASLGNPPGFGEQPFASLQHAALRVRLLPLLRGQLEIGRVEVDGLDLHLLKNAAGRGNWESPSTGSTAPTGDAAGGPELRALAGIRITHSRISYQDLVADHFNLEVGRVADGIEVPIEAKLDLTPHQGAEPIAIAAKFALTLKSAKNEYRLAPMELEGTLPAPAGGARVPWKFSAPRAELDLSAQTLEVPAVAAQLGSAKLSGSLKGSKIVEAPEFGGSFNLGPASPRELMSQLGMSQPKTRDAKAFGSFSASGEYRYGDKRAGVSQLTLQLDDSKLTGTAAVTDLDSKAMSFDLSLDHIDIDRYRAPVEASAKAPPAKDSAEAPSDVLKTLRLEGKFALGSATFAGLRVAAAHLTIEAKDGVTHIAPLTASLYGGQYSGDVTLDDRGEVLASKLEQTLTNVDIAALLQDFIKSKRFSGHGTITTSLTARGSGGDTVLKSLNGRVTSNLADGAVEGIDLWFEINRAVALMQKQSPPSGASSGRTKFDAFKASADVVNGVATTKDLNIASQNLRVTGQGSTNLITQAVDYQVKATVLKEAPGAANAAGASLADIPLLISGSIGDPKVRPDLEGLAKARVQQELDKHKDELKQKLQNKLQDLFK